MNNSAVSKDVLIAKRWDEIKMRGDMLMCPVSIEDGWFTITVNGEHIRYSELPDVSIFLDGVATQQQTAE